MKFNGSMGELHAPDAIWSKPQNHIPGLLSLLAHVIALTAFIVLSINSTKFPKSLLDSAVSESFVLSSPLSGVRSAGGGGGGTRSQTPASLGILPKISNEQLVPPTAVIINMAPELMAEPTIITLAQATLPKSGLLLKIGDPSGVLGLPSSGKGTGGGIGDEGNGTGVGPGKGPGFGPGDGNIPGNGVVRIGALGATAPSCPLPASEPTYTDDARKAHISGTVTLNVIVNRDGSVTVAGFAQRIGYGLDDEASQFVAKSFHCRPGIYQGQAVATPIKIDVNFHLY